MFRGALITLIGFYSSLSFAQTCPAGATWVKPHPRDSYVRSDGTFVSATEVLGHCRSKSKAYDFWASKIVNGRPAGWENKTETSSLWTRDDLEAVLQALDKIPEFLWHNVKIYRMKKSIMSKNPASFLDNSVVLYDLSFGGSHSLERIIAHELAHKHYLAMTPFDRTVYHNASGWFENRPKSSATSPHLVNHAERFAISDSHIDAEEDFANNAEAFLYDKTRLKYKNSSLYDWFVIEFGDKLKKRAQ